MLKISDFTLDTNGYTTGDRSEEVVVTHLIIGGGNLGKTVLNANTLCVLLSNQCSCSPAS